MELGGDEKRIRALFSELSFEDQSHAPSFGRLWRKAESTESARPRNWRLSTAAVALCAAAIVTVAALAAWSWSAPTTNLPTQNALNIIPNPTPAAPAPDRHDSSSPTDHPRSQPQRKKRQPRYRVTDSAVAGAAMLSSWQSPTSSLLQSPTGFALNTLPQLNESAEQLKQFLPKNNDATKESNQ